MKECGRCKQIKSFDCFYKAGGRNKAYTSRAGYASVCKECRLIERKEDYRLNPEKYKKSDRAFNLRQSYGLSLKDWDDMFLNQKGCCAICNAHQSDLKSVLCVDHDHSTGKIRQLLCVPCNLTLGYMKDNVERLYSAIDYLNKHNNGLAEKTNIASILPLRKEG